MATANLSAVLRAPAHPMAKAGYGKRDAPDQAPPRADDFGGLEPREAAIAAYVDRLPEGAAIGYKVLAEELPDYGQQACRSALDRLTRAGHLRRVRVQVALSDGQMRWVTRTYFSRTARDADWWAAHVRFVRGMDAPGQPPAPVAAETAEEPEPGVRAPRSEAYDVLAGLGRHEPRLQLSEGDCVQLEHLVGEWLARGVGREQITQVLTSGLPASVHSAGPLLRKRLETKMPPSPAPRPENDHPGEQIVGMVMMCLFCDEDETTTTLDHGVCLDCKEAIARDEAMGLTGDVPDTFLARPRAEIDVAARVAELRSATVRPVLPAPRPRR
ncbi:hypothetical protein [Streptomyces sp. wa1063]|uniref:hypothetical protein n=1 Tax=Streptomyces sp. wa1063 TaxID=1828212 RepID=UPI00211D2709|nr:hypothetical protein [Streptomyces sp. wa1063]